MDSKKSRKDRQTVNWFKDVDFAVDIQVEELNKDESISDFIEKYTSPKFIDSGQEVSVLFNTPVKERKQADKPIPDEISEYEKEEGELSPDKSKNKKVKGKYFDFIMFKMVMKRYTIKVINGQQAMFYNPDEGNYDHVNETELKIRIRSGWGDDIQKKIGRNVLQEIVERIMTEPSIQVDEDYFNCYPNLMNFLNFTYDVEKDKRMKHSPEYRLTSCIQANYEDNPLNADTFLKFLKTSLQNDVQKIEHLQEIIGYMLSEYSKSKKIPMIIGEKHSGKSMLNSIITELIGKKHVSHVPLHRLGERFVLSNLFMKKANINSEIGDDPLANIDIVKGISGGDDMLTEFKGKDHFSYRSKIKLLFSGNHAPNLKNRDVASAFYDRITFVKFNRTIPENARDHAMEEKILKNDRSFIAWWAVEGLKRLRENNFVFSESDESIEFKKRYIIEQNNTIDFIKSHCEIGAGNKVHLKSLYGRYIRYCHENCFVAYSKEDFFAEISKYKVTKKKFRIGGSEPLWGYTGIKLLKDDF